MNFRKLLTYFAFGTAAVMPFAGAQNPTILQGNYITNVFGNSNFVLNPNAQTNTANVTFTSTQVTRSTTTPLVATSEFNLSLLQNANADWSTRAFDAGMKGQNCEARFTYRGFATATTTAQIIQNSLVVAQLVLTPSTDPRIASINFPCGDLSFGTTFRIAQTTAAMTGTNEIGGIYVGLATNMANVAQAEMVGAVQWQGCATPEPARTGSTAFGNFSGGGSCSGKTLFGKATSANEADASITFNNLPAGYYFLQTNTFAYIAAPSTASIVGQVEVYEDTSGAMSGRTYIQSQVANTLVHTLTPSGWYYFATTANRTFRLRGSISNAANTLQVSLGFSGGSQATQFALYRFPSSSELVVKPETQNVFGGVRLYSASDTNSVSTASWTKLTTNLTATRTTYGRADTTATNDLSITIKNLPVGSYKIDATGVFIARTASAGTSAACLFSLSDSATAGSPLASLAQNAYGDTSIGAQDILASSMSGIYVNTAVADRTFFIRAYRAAGSGSCLGTTSDASPTTITVTPLDQPTNSALYVQGPVLGAQTGAAIPSGYQGYTVESTLTGTTTPTNSNQYYTTESVSLTPGVWSCYADSAFYYSGAGNAPTGFTSFTSGICAGVNCTPASAVSVHGANITATSNANDYGAVVNVSKVFNVSSTTTYYLTSKFTFTARNALLIDNNSSTLRCTLLN